MMKLSFSVATAAVLWLGAAAFAADKFNFAPTQGEFKNARHVRTPDRWDGLRWNKMSIDARDRLNGLRDGLLRLHTTLLASQRATYERDVERIVSTGQYFNLVMSDAQFAWLRELSRFIVEIDELLDQKKPQAAPDAEQWIGRARSLFSPAEDGAPFARAYFEAMQRDPGVVLAHGEMMRVFAAVER